MAIFYTSDLHLGHRNCLIFDQRPFSSIEEMKDELIRKWNTKVTSEDTVYILGDIAYGPSVEEVSTFVKCLNGKKILIQGNHDFCYVNGTKKVEGFDEIHPLYQVRDEDQWVILCHYPMAAWNYSHRGSIHLYGHVHLNEKALQEHSVLANIQNAYNVGCMNWNYEPVTLREILEKNS